MTAEEISRLLARVAGGDLLALEVIYQELRDPVYAVALAITRSPASAFEVARKTFAQLREGGRGPVIKHGKQWVIRRACSLAHAQPRVQPAAVTKELTLEKYIMRQTFFRLSMSRRQVLLLMVAGSSLSECAGILRRPLGLIRRWYRESLDCLGNILEQAPKAPLASHSEGEIHKLLKSALSLLEAPSFELICDDIRQGMENLPKRRNIPWRVFGSSAMFICIVTGAVWAVVAGNKQEEIPAVRLSSSEEVDAGSEREGVLHYLLTEDSATGAVIYNVMPSDPPVTLCCTQAQQKAAIVEDSSPGDGNIAPGLAYYMEDQGERDGFDVVISSEDLSPKEQRELQAASLLVLDDASYYFYLGPSQIEYLAESGFVVELVGGGPPSRPEGVPQNIDDAAAWISKHMGESEELQVRYQVSLPGSGQGLAPLEELLKNCGISSYDPEKIAAVPDETDPAQTNYNGYLALTSVQMYRLAGSNAEGQISAAFLLESGPEAEKYYYYTAFGDGWVMK